MNITESDISAVNNVFHQPPVFANCAQSVAIMTGHDDWVKELAACGGGRAPGGLCGALHTALRIAPEDKRDDIIAAFKASVGATTCREIKSSTGTPCAVCVAVAKKLCD